LKGKGTLVNKLMDEFPDDFGFSVSHTSRGPRPGEVDGVHYNFSDRDTMQAMIDNGEFLEYADVHGRSVSCICLNSRCSRDLSAATRRRPLTFTCVVRARRFYGTTFKAVTQVSEQGRICVLDIDIQGVRSVKQSDLDPRYAFINPPSFEMLEQRLRGR
jgi:guanylate kinase